MDRRRRPVGTSAVLTALVISVACRPAPPADRPERSSSHLVTLAEAQPVIEALGDRAPADLRATLGSVSGRGAAWDAWITERDRGVRARLAQGDEDSVVHLMLYGTSFTGWPRATPDALASAPGTPSLDDVMAGRMTDFVAAMESPGANERIAFAREVLERQGLAVSPTSRRATIDYLTSLRSRVLAANEAYQKRRSAAATAPAVDQAAAYATLYRDRGLSSDTSLRINFAVDRTLAALYTRGLVDGQLQHAAVVGPGLDFTDKAQGYDFYPIQTLQPFAVLESLRRIGAAAEPDVTAFDISHRVLGHLERARQRAAAGEPYRVRVVLEVNGPEAVRNPELAQYWGRFGDHIAAPAEDPEVPAGLRGQLRARSVAVRPAVVGQVAAADLNVVFTRPAMPGQFDLVVATNVLVYYDVFEQALAGSNVASMLRRGGLLITNQPLPLAAAYGLSSLLINGVVYTDAKVDPSEIRGDTMYVYQRI